jgi:hypothetical protein
MKDKFNENIKIISSKNLGVDFEEERNKLCTLLTDHPFFIQEIPKIRKKYKIPTDSFCDPQKAFYWEHKNRQRRNEFVKDINKFIDNLTIPRAYRPAIFSFLYDYILTNKPIHKNAIQSQNRASITITDSDRDINKYLINPNSLYIEIYKWTTKRDLDEAYKQIKEIRKEKEQIKVSKIEGLARDIWILTKRGLSDKQIKKELDTAYQKTFDYKKIPSYRKRYKDQLNKIKKID